MFALAAVLTALTALRVQAGTQTIQLQYESRPDTRVESPAEEAFALWERFKLAFDQRVDDAFTDRFHPFNAMNWAIALENRDAESFRENATRAAFNTLSKSAVYAVREATIDLPLMVWLEERQGLLADLLRNSVGSVSEEAVSPLDLSYNAIERSWWKRLSESSNVRYGIRPFRTSPYAFFSLGLKDGDNLLLLGHVRYRLRNFADHRFELAVSVPLAHGYALDLGTSCQFGTNDEAGKLVLKFFKGFKSGGVLHVGLDVQEKPALFAGLSIPW